MAEVIVLDASAIIAVIQSEPGGDLVLDLKTKPLVSTVNIVEARTKLFDFGHTAAQVDELMKLVDMIEVDFTSAQSRIASGMRDTTRHAGLSLGDRACLALAVEKNAVAMTTDQQWAKVDVAVRVELIR
jgi:ribonuclease VapC